MRTPLCADCPKLAVAPVSEANSPITISSGFPDESFFLHPENNNPQTMTAINAPHESDPKSTRERMFRFINFTNWEMAFKDSSPYPNKRASQIQTLSDFFKRISQEGFR